MIVVRKITLYIAHICLYFEFSAPNRGRILNLPKTTQPQTWCKLWILPADVSLSSTCINVGFIRLHQFCENQTWYNFIFADLLRVVETICIKLVDKKSWQSTCIKSVDNLQQTCYHLAGASDDVNDPVDRVSAWWLQDNKACSRLAPLWSSSSFHFQSTNSRSVLTIFWIG